jgi:hypothetical protein
VTHVFPDKKNSFVFPPEFKTARSKDQGVAPRTVEGWGLYIEDPIHSTPYISYAYPIHINPQYKSSYPDLQEPLLIFLS